MKRTLLSLFLAVLLLLSVCGAAAAVSFPDVTGHPLEEAIGRAVELGIINGYTDGTFRPDGSVTRAEFCAMTNRALGLAGRSVLTFTDVPVSAWYFGDVQKAVTLGYIVGMPGNRFEPDGLITRYQCALIFARLSAYEGAGVSLTWSDADSVPEWARSGAAFAQESGVYSAFVSEALEGDTPLTRAETACALVSLLDGFEKRPVYCTLVRADAENRPVDTETLYKNEYARLSFLVCGRELADRAAEDAVRLSVTGAIGIRTLDADGRLQAQPAAAACTRVDADTLRFDVTLDRTDYLPAWLTASAELSGDADGAYAVRSEPVFVKYTLISEYLPAAAEPMVLHRAQNAETRIVHRYLSWSRSPYADYSVEFCVCDADGGIVSRRVYNGAYTEHEERIEIDMTEFLISHPEAAYGAGAYQTVVVSAESSSRSCRFYPSVLPLNAAQYVQLDLDGHDESRAAVVGKEGTALGLSEVHLDTLTGGADYTCSLTVTVLDAGYQDVTGQFSLDGPVPLRHETDVTELTRSGPVPLGTLTAASAEPGIYTLLLQFTVSTEHSAQSLYLSGALVVE